MTIKTETVHKELSATRSRLHSYRMMYSRRSDIVKVHRLYVPLKADTEVQVLGVWIGEAGENHLLEPCSLRQLNNLLGCPSGTTIACARFDWATLWGVEVQLASAEQLMVMVTLKVSRPYHEQEFDRAWIAWLKLNPGKSVDDFAEFARLHVLQGHVLCEVNQCEEAAVIGTTLCHEHQKFFESR